MMSELAQWISESIGGGSPTEMGFWKWCAIFIPVFVFLKWISSDDKD